MKKHGILLVIIMTVTILMSGCVKGNASLQKMKEWEKTARLDTMETSDELYEAAKKEDILKIYTVSSRLFDVAESFQKQYPELLVEVEYYRAEEIRNKLYENANNSLYDCDLIFTTNGDGNLTEDLIPNMLAYLYVPADIEPFLRKGGSDKYLSILLETPLLTYNTNAYEDVPPVHSWWDLTKAEWKDKLYITDPTKSMISYTVFSMLICNSSELEMNYKDCFGESLVMAKGENAGQILIRKLVENGMKVLNDSDDVASSIAAPGSSSDALGLLNASKLRLNKQGYTLATITDIEPFAGVINPASILIAGGAKNINSAKLFIRWILGETDGKGEGYKPFLQVGAWPSRVDVTGGDSVAIEDMKVIYTDESYSSKERDEFLTFWTGLME